MSYHQGPRFQCHVLKDLGVSDHLRCRVDGEFQLGLLAEVNREPLHEEGCEPGSSPASEGVENQEPLESSALLSLLPDSIQNLQIKMSYVSIKNFWPFKSKYWQFTI